MNLRMDEGVEFIYAKNYLYIGIPLRTREEPVLKRGQHVFLEAAGTIDNKGRQVVEVEPNPALAEFGQAQPSYRVHPESGVIQLGVWFSVHKQVDISELDYLVRLYMYA